MFQMNTVLTPASPAIFMARLPLPPGLSRIEREIHRTRTSSQRARLRRFHAEASKQLAEAAFYDFGTIVRLRESHFRIPLTARIKFFYPYKWQIDQIGQEQEAIGATLRYLDLSEHPVVEVYVQKFIDAKDPHTEISLFCTA